ncbi:MAG: hypothetical protein KDK40_02555, partial [Chlamydiia bacterium]|nr:hypothetical protein [Chlamydiia bacterium]
IEKKITVEKEKSVFEIVLGSDCDREGVAEWKERVEKEREFSITRRDLPHAEKCYSITDKRSYGVRKERLEGIASELIGELKSSSSEDRLYLVVAAFREISRLHLFRMGNARSECLFFNLLMHQLKLCPVFPRTMTLFRGYTLENTLKEVIQGQQAFVSRFVDLSRFNLKLDAYEKGMIEAAARNKQVESRATS